MKRYSFFTFAGLTFGLATGCWEGFIAYLDSLLDPFSAHNHWYGLLLIIPAIFALPGMALNFWIYNPPDGNYGDEWDYYTPALIFNALFWMISFVLLPVFFRFVKFLWLRATSVYQTQFFLARLTIREKLGRDFERLDGSSKQEKM